MPGNPKQKANGKIDQRLQDVVAILNGLVKVNNSILKSSENSQKHLYTAKKELSELKNISSILSETNNITRESSDKLSEISNKTQEEGIERKKNTSWNKITSYYSQQISKAFDNAEKNQKASLLLGQQSYQFQRKSSVNLDSMAGNLTGFQEAFEVSYSKVSAGLDVNSYALDRLGVATKIAGGNTNQLFQALKKNTVGLGFSNKQLSNLADTTLSLNQGFGVSVDELTNSLEGLSENLLEFGILGVAPQMEEAALRLGAALGQGATGLGAQVLASFTKGGSMVQSSILGITEERERALLTTGKAGTKASMDLVLAAGRKSKQLIDGFIKGAKDPAFALSQATKIYGRESLQAYQYYNALQQKATEKGYATAEQYLESVRKQNEINEDFTKTWENFKSTILTPLMRTMTRGYNAIAEFLTENEKFYDAAVSVGKAVTILASVLGGLSILKKGASFFSNLLGGLLGGSGKGPCGCGIGGSLVPGVLEGAKGLALGIVSNPVAAAVTAISLAVPAAALYDTYGGDPKETKVWQIKEEKHTKNLKERMEKMAYSTEKIEFLAAQARSEEAYAKSEGRETDKILLHTIEKLTEEVKQSNNHLEVMKNDSIGSKPQKKYNS